VPDKSQLSPKQYLQTMMACDLVHDSATIVQHRNDYLNVAAPAIPSLASYDFDEMQALRVQANQQLAAIRSKFWELPSDQLKSAIAQLDADSLPDLKLSVTRLSYLAERREEFDKIADSDRCDPQMLDCIKRLLLMSRSSAVSERERIGRQLDAKSRASATTMLKLMRAKHADVYNLEREWFDQIVKQGNKRISEKWMYISIVLGILLVIVLIILFG